MTRLESPAIARRPVRRGRAAIAVALSVTAISMATHAIVAASPAAASVRGDAARNLDGGLLLDRGKLKRLPDVPNSVETVHLRNNDRGDVVGSYVTGSDPDTSRSFGFIIRDGRLTRFGVPGARFTVPLGVNDRGQVVGGYADPDAVQDPVTGEYGPTHGFVWDRGRIERFDAPGANTTSAYEINNRGQIVGHFADANDVQHAYIRTGRRFRVLDHPEATDTPKLTGTRGVGIDDRGRIVGGYGDDAGTLRAYKWERGRFTTIHPRGASNSEASQIDSRGRIIGRYLDAKPKLRSFLLDGGRLTRIDIPGRCDTAAFGLNDRGQIVIPATGTTDGSTCPQPGTPPMP